MVRGHGAAPDAFAQPEERARAHHRTILWGSAAHDRTIHPEFF